MSWESTVPYDQVINRTVARERGDLHSGRIVLCSVDSAEIERRQNSSDWDGTAAVTLLDTTILHEEHAALVALDRRDVTAEG